MMLLNVIAALALNSVICFASPLPVTAPEACAPIHIMSARGSNQPQGEGPTLTPLADAIAAAHPGSSREPIVWPANIIPYDINSHNGTLAVTAQLTAYVKKCPTSKIVMLGYSQGAHVIMDSLCGGGGVVGIGPITPPISKDIGSHVTAFVGFGDPRHVAGEPYNRGTSHRNGLFPRLPSQSCAYYASRMESYCDQGDFYCDRGLDATVHGSYIPRYLPQALSFVNRKLM